MGFSQSLSSNSKQFSSAAGLDSAAVRCCCGSTHVCETLVLMCKHPIQSPTSSSFCSATLCTSASENRSEQREQREWERKSRRAWQWHFGGAFVVPSGCSLCCVMLLKSEMESYPEWCGRGREGGRKWRWR